MSAADDVVRFFHAVDDRAWPAVRAGLADQVSSDYTSLFGGAPERLAANALVTRWQGLLPGFDGTQHLLGPLVVEQTGDDATVACNVRAYHHLGGSTWLVAGRYFLTLRRLDRKWRVAGIVLRTTYEEGDRSLTSQASARATANPAPS
jgi:SnoaL-like domain